MNVKMRHAFTCVGSAVDDNSIAGLLDPELFRKLTGDEQQLPENSGVTFLRNSQPRNHFLGTIRTWTGACGFTSWNAIASSSSQMILAGISRAIIFSKIVMANQRSEVREQTSAINAASISSARWLSPSVAHE